MAAAAAELAERLARPGGPAPAGTAAPAVIAAAGPVARHATSQRAGARGATPLKRARQGDGGPVSLHGGRVPELQPLKRSRHAGERAGSCGVNGAGFGSPRAGAGSPRAPAARGAPQQQRPLSADDVVRQRGAAARATKTGASRLDSATLMHAAAPAAAPRSAARVPNPPGGFAARGPPGAGSGGHAAAGGAWGAQGPASSVGGPPQGLPNGAGHTAGQGGWKAAAPGAGAPAGGPGFGNSRDAALAAEQQSALAVNEQSAEQRLMQHARRLRQARTNTAVGFC